MNDTYTKLLGASALVIMIGRGILLLLSGSDAGLFAILGAVVFAFAVLGVGAEGYFIAGPIRMLAVDAFHYTFALSLMCLSRALTAVFKSLW
jgi:hypothetical protein